MPLDHYHVLTPRQSLLPLLPSVIGVVRGGRGVAREMMRLK